jgi:hypothetical protein
MCCPLWGDVRLRPCATPMFLSGRRPKPDVGNLLIIGACAFIGRNRLDMRACHPASKTATELDERGFHAPPPGFHRRCDDIGRLTGRSQEPFAGVRRALVRPSYKMAVFARRSGGHSAIMELSLLPQSCATHGHGLDDSSNGT